MWGNFKSWINLLLPVAYLSGLFYARVYRRRLQQHKEHLETILSAHGLRFVSAEWPGLLQTGPFPKFQVLRVSTNVGGVSGEPRSFWIVTFQDSGGVNHRIWANVQYEAFHLRWVRWRAFNGEDLPEAAKALLEG